MFLPIGTWVEKLIHGDSTTLRTSIYPTRQSESRTHGTNFCHILENGEVGQRCKASKSEMGVPDRYHRQVQGDGKDEVNRLRR
jgi:hypothetical protein